MTSHKDNPTANSDTKQRHKRVKTTLELDASIQFSIDREMMAHLAESLMGVTVSLHALVIGDE